MPEPSSNSGAAAVSDHRPVPRGVLPRGLQMWLMVGVAAAMLVIVMLTGHSQPVPRAMSASAAPQLSGLSPDRLRDYQDRLRALDERARVETTADSSKNPPARVRETDTGSRQPDPLDAERKRREYE